MNLVNRKISQTALCMWFVPNAEQVTLVIEKCFSTSFLLLLREHLLFIFICHRISRVPFDWMQCFSSLLLRIDCAKAICYIGLALFHNNSIIRVVHACVYSLCCIQICRCFSCVCVCKCVCVCCVYCNLYFCRTWHFK